MKNKANRRLTKSSLSHRLAYAITNGMQHTFAVTDTYTLSLTHKHIPAIAFLAITRACETNSLPRAQYGWGRTSDPPDSDSESKNKF